VNPFQVSSNIIKAASVPISIIISEESKKVIINPSQNIGSAQQIVSSSVFVKSTNLIQPAPIQFLNNHPKRFQFVNPDPVAVMVSAFEDLMILLNKFKGKGQAMFNEVRKTPQFECIEKEISSVRSSKFLIKGIDKGKEEKWLQTNEDKLCFFLNLHNFLVLFALCKDGSKPLPKTQLEWTNYLKSIYIKVGPHILAAHEIEHAILRSFMNMPKMPCPYIDQHVMFPKFSHEDPKSELIYPRKEVLINFAIYIPTKSAPNLRIYKPGKIMTQMKDNATKFLLKHIKEAKSVRSSIILPTIFEWYEADFIRGNDYKDDILFFAANCLPKDSAIHSKLTTGSVKEIEYEKYDWSFDFSFIPDS